MLNTFVFWLILCLFTFAIILSIVLIHLSLKDDDLGTCLLGCLSVVILVFLTVVCIRLECFDNKSHTYDVYKITYTTETNKDTISKQEYQVYIVEDETNILRITCDGKEKVEYEIGQTFVAYRKDLGDFEKLN